MPKMTQHTIAPTNYTRGGNKPTAFVIHIQQGFEAGTISWFKNPKSQVSSHIAVSKKGVIDRFMEESDTAYHAGRVNKPIWSLMQKTAWGTFKNPNGYTIGIECEGFRGDKWTEAQMQSLVDYIREVAPKFGIPFKRANIVSHNEITADKENMTEWCDEIIRRLLTDKATVKVCESCGQAIK